MSIPTFTFSKCFFFEGPDASMKEIPSLECSEGGGEITVLRCSSWHHEAKDRTSKQLSFSEPRASFLFETHIKDALCSSLIAVDEVDGLPSAEVLKMFSLTISIEPAGVSVTDQISGLYQESMIQRFWRQGLGTSISNVCVCVCFNT